MRNGAVTYPDMHKQCPMKHKSWLQVPGWRPDSCCCRLGLVLYSTHVKSALYSGLI
jgi:hypothetical protein